MPKFINTMLGGLSLMLLASPLQAAEGSLTLVGTWHGAAGAKLGCGQIVHNATKIEIYQIKTGGYLFREFTAKGAIDQELIFPALPECSSNTMRFTAAD